MFDEIYIAISWVLYCYVMRDFDSNITDSEFTVEMWCTNIVFIRDYQTYHSVTA